MMQQLSQKVSWYLFLHDANWFVWHVVRSCLKEQPCSGGGLRGLQSRGGSLYLFVHMRSNGISRSLKYKYPDFFFLPSYTWQITGGKWAGWSKLSTHGKLQKLLGAVHCWFWAFDSKKNIEYHQPYPLTRNWNLIQMGLKWKLKTTMTEWLWNKTLLRHSSDQNILHQKLNCALVSVRT